MKTYVHNFTSKQVHLNDFDNSNDFTTIPETAVTHTGNVDYTFSETGFTLNPYYRCRCRRGYTLSSDPHNDFKRQIEPVDHSRNDISRSYRLGFRGGF